MPIKSILKAGIDLLPEKAKVKGASLPNVLKKQGVKDEELKFAGLEIRPEKSYTKAELQELEAGRKDVFGKEQSESGYNFISLEAGINNPTYKENVYTFAEGKLLDKEVSFVKAQVEEYNQLLKQENSWEGNIDDLYDKQDEVIEKLRQRFIEVVPNEVEAGMHWSDIADGIVSGDITAGSRYTSGHFQDVPNYLMHTRTYDDTIDGVPTRVVQEIQSDLHQQARAQGGYTGQIEVVQPTPAEIEAFQAFNDGYTDRADEVMEGLDRIGFSRADIEDNDIGELAADALAGDLPGAKAIPETPYQKSWLAKGIERELDLAINEGRQQLAIPIKGAGIENLKRAPGVQGWYEGNVANTAKKIAKQNGMDFELVESGGTTFKGFTDFDYWENQADEFPSTFIEALEETFGSHPTKDVTLELRSAIGEGHMQRFEDEVERLAEGTQYAIIKPKGEAYVGDLMTKAESDEHIELALAPMNRTRSEVENTRLAELESKKANQGKKMFKAEKPNLKLYSSPAAAVGAAYASLKAGGTDDDVRFELSQQGYDADEADFILKETKIYQDGLAQGFSEQDMLAAMAEDEHEIADVSSTPITTAPEKSFWERAEDTARLTTGNTKKEAYATVTGDEQMSAEQLVSRLRTIQPNMSSITTRMSGYAGNEVDFNKARQAVEASVQRIVNMAQERGTNLVWVPPEEVGLLETLEASGGGKFMVETDQGRVDVTPGFWESMREEQSEITLGVGGAFAGAKVAAQWSKHPVVVAGGSLIGAMIGASTGTEIDYLRDSVTLAEDMSAEIAAHKALTAGEASIIGDLVGYPLAKSAGLIWDGVKKAKDLLLDGNTQGALKSLKSTMFIDEATASEMVERLNKSVQADPKKANAAEQQIRATVLTEPGGEAIVQPAGILDPQAGRAVAESIKRRTTDVLSTTAELTDENVAKMLTEDLANYTAGVKQFYGDVKEQVSLSPRINNFSFDYDKLAINPVLETLGKNITDPNVLEKFRLQAQKVRDMSDSRTLTDLIELRQIVNDFKFNTRISKAKDFKQLNSILGDIDGAITQGANVVMENPKQWLSNYSEAKINYAKMKGLEKNVLAKLLRRPGINQELVVKSLTKYINALDGTFNDVLSKLPMKQRAMSEGTVINALAEKFSVKGEATHFPLLAAELNKVVFTTPEARKAKAALNELAQVFKNDIPLAQAAGNIQIPKFQSFLTADPVMRAKFEFATSMFNGIKSRLPTQKAGNISLVTKTAKLLEEPLNAKAMKDFMEAADGDVNLTKMATDMQKEAARVKSQGKDVGSAKIIMYGDGALLKPSGKGKEHKIPFHRIASYDKVKEIANKYAIDLNDKVQLNGALKDEGYMAVQAGSDQVRRLK